MSMKIANNAQARTARNSFNINKTKSEKSLDKLSSGLKIVRAADNSSAWAISERMRVLIRAFSQDHQNIQNDSSLVRTAERGIDQIVQNLRTLKELAIDAANDSNNDWDRSVIQKEVDQRLETINDIAHGTKYNGKILLNGIYRESVFSPENTTVEGIIDSFDVAYNATDNSSAGMLNGSTVDDWLFEVDKSFAKDEGNWSWAAEWLGSALTMSSQRDQFAVSLDFSGMTAMMNYPQTLHEQGFSILCGGCEQFINIVFDATKSAAESTYGRPHGGQGNGQAREFVIGVKNVQSAEDLPEAILEGVYANASETSSPYYDSSTPDNVQVDFNHQLRIARDPDDHSKILLLKDFFDMQFLDHPIRKTVEGNPLWAQHGTSAGQRINIYINSMTRDALGLENLSVRTIEDANSAIDIITGAIEYALNEATNMGAYLQRLEVTNLNITTQDENAQAAESTIRDADMAKEMTNYMRYKILAQSSQVMISQANQNQASVVNLLR